MVVSLVMDHSFEITANCVDVVAGKITPATVRVRDGRIVEIEPTSSATGYLLPGFVDAHIHIESSMLLPTQFAQVAMTHGTVATVSDPHEIANVCGIDGIEFMLQDAEKTPFKFHFGAPSCVPATDFETAGARIGVEGIERLLDDPRINHLSEMMNFPAVIARQPEVMAKLKAAQKRNLPIDGHAPGLRGSETVSYFSAGISTDHECVGLEEAEEKILAGCKIAIREGSAARNFDALWPLIDRYPESCMFCSDDKHPDELMLGHINQLVVRAIEKGCDLFNVLRAASMNTVQHYRLDVGLLQVGDPADFILVDNLQDFQVRQTYVSGQLVAKDGESQLSTKSSAQINKFEVLPLSAESLVVPATSNRVRTIQVIDGQLLTQLAETDVPTENGIAQTDPENDILKLVVVNRYRRTNPAVGFVRGFGMRGGALASSVAHDSHNVLAVGANDDEILEAINQIIDHRGGLAVVANEVVDVLPLPVAGLMSTESCERVAAAYSRLDQRAKQAGCPLQAPFMTLSFLSLPVIPSLKLTDLGLFDVERFECVSLFV